MRRIPVRRPSPALVVACAALAVALGGTSYASVVAIPSSSVGTAQLKNGAVTTAKLKNGAVASAKVAANAVTSAKVKNSSLLKVDFAPGQLPAGPTGPQGPAGPAGVSGLQRVDLASSTNSASSKTAVAACPSGKKVIGGGARVIGNGAGAVSIVDNFPDSDSVHWNARAVEVVATVLTWQLQAYALCAVVGA
jgi:hypothetical protein